MKNRGHSLIDHILVLLDRLRANGVEFERLMRDGERASALDTLGGMDDQSLRMANEILDFMDEMPGGFLTYRANGDEEILYANQGLLRIFQCDSMEEFRTLTGGSFRGIVAPEDLEAVEESIWQQVDASQYDLDYVEYRIIRKDGAVRWIEDYGHFVRDTSVGDIFYVFLADATDKMERRQAEEARLLQEKERSEREWRSRMEAYDKERARINQEHLRHREVIEGLSVNYESIFYVNLDEDKILPYRLSSRTESIFNEPYHTLDYAGCIRRYVEAWVHPEDRERVIREADADYARRMLKDNEAYSINYRVISQGETQYLQVRFVNVGQKARPSQVVMGCRRVDEELRRELEQKQILEEALRDAQASIVAKNTFLSNMSHDMRTPLNAIFGFTTLMKNSLGDHPEALDYLNRIESSSRQLLDMIDKVLRLSWTDSHEARVEEKPCRLGEILEEVRDFLLPQASEKHIDLTLDCSQVRHDEICGDREKLGQLVMYLVNNAVTYTPSGGSVSITVEEGEELSGSSAMYRIAVQDTGIGISEEFLKQIFEPFTRERNTTLSGIHGVGLGLTIARNLANLLGGTIEVSSVVDKGSAFTVTLRLRFRNQEAYAPPAGETSSEKSACRRILLVDDNELNMEIESAILESLGFEIDSAADGSIALAKLRSAPPGRYDLVLMDIQMPVMDGWQAARAIRSLPDHTLAQIPIIALSANSFENDIRTSLEAGMDAHLPKPIDVPVLLSAIDKIMIQRTAG